MDFHFNRIRHLATRVTNAIMSYPEDNIDHVGGVTLNKVTTGYGSVNFLDTVHLTVLESVLSKRSANMDKTKSVYVCNQFLLTSVTNWIHIFAYLIESDRI